MFLAFMSTGTMESAKEAVNDDDWGVVKLLGGLDSFDGPWPPLPKCMHLASVDIFLQDSNPHMLARRDCISEEKPNLSEFRLIGRKYRCEPPKVNLHGIPSGNSRPRSTHEALKLFDWGRVYSHRV